MRKPETRKYLLTLALSCIIAVMAGCGGGGGGTAAPVALSTNAPWFINDTPKSSPGGSGEIPSQTEVEIFVQGKTDNTGNLAECRVKVFGDNKGGSEWKDCWNQTSFKHIYENDSSTANFSPTAILGVRDKESGKVIYENLELVIAPKTAPPVGAPSEPIVTCPASGAQDVEVTCNLETSTNSSSCVVDCGNGEDPDTISPCPSAIGCTYKELEDDEMGFDIQVYAQNSAGKSTNGSDRVIIRKTASDLTSCPSVFNSTDFTKVGNDDCHLQAKTTIASTEKTWNGGMLNSCKEIWEISETGAETKASTVNSAAGTWSFKSTNLVASGKNKRKFFCKNARGDESPRLTVDFYSDTTKPGRPEMNPPSDNCTTNPTILLTGTREMACTLTINGVVVDNGVEDFGTVPTIVDWDYTYTFTTEKTYRFTAHCEDPAGNDSLTPDNYREIRYDADSCTGGGGGGDTVCGNGACEGGETVDNCSADCGSSSGSGDFTLNDTFDVADNSVDITSYNGELPILFTNGSVKFYSTNGGETTYTMTGAPSFGTPKSVGACSSNNRLAIADQTKNTTGLIDVFTIDTANTKLEFAFSFGYSNTETDGKLKNPDRIFCDFQNNFWVLDRGNKSVKKYNSSGTLSCQYKGAVTLGNDIYADNAGNIYVPNSGTDRVDVIDSSCSFLKVVGSGSTTGNPLENPTMLAVNGAGTEMFVADTGHNQWSIYNPSTRTDLGYIGYGNSADPKGMAIVSGTAYILWDNTVGIIDD